MWIQNDHNACGCHAGRPALKFATAETSCWMFPVYNELSLSGVLSSGIVTKEGHFAVDPLRIPIICFHPLKNIQIWYKRGPKKSLDHWAVLVDMGHWSSKSIPLQLTGKLHTQGMISWSWKNTSHCHALGFGSLPHQHLTSNKFYQSVLCLLSNVIWNSFRKKM